MYNQQQEKNSNESFSLSGWALLSDQHESSDIFTLEEKLQSSFDSADSSTVIINGIGIKNNRKRHLSPDAQNDEAWLALLSPPITQAKFNYKSNQKGFSRKYGENNRSLLKSNKPNNDQCPKNKEKQFGILQCTNTAQRSKKDSSQNFKTSSTLHSDDDEDDWIFPLSGWTAPSSDTPRCNCSSSSVLQFQRIKPIIYPQNEF